jgi:hypothetical protein
MVTGMARPINMLASHDLVIEAETSASRWIMIRRHACASHFSPNKELTCSLVSPRHEDSPTRELKGGLGESALQAAQVDAH